MGIEIERKYTLKNDDWRKTASSGEHIVQAYLQNSGSASVRIRIEGNEANINIKSMTLGIRRLEYEYSIPVDEARELIDELCIKPYIDKHRYIVQKNDLKWEIDEFHGDNEGLVVAEVELTDENQEIDMPEWIDKEVSDDKRYYNVRLIEHPYSQWGTD